MDEQLELFEIYEINPIPEECRIQEVEDMTKLLEQYYLDSLESSQ